MKNKLLKILFLLFAAAQFLFAQGGPIYSRYGIGDQIHSTTARRMGFGDLGSAVIDKDYVDGYNPASWTNLKFTRFGISGKYIRANYSDNSGSAFYNNAIFSGFTLGFPVDRDLGISFALGLVPVAALKYDIEQNVQDTILGDHTDEYSGSGSVSKFFIGASTLLPYNFSLGATFEYHSGTNKYSSSKVFSGTTTSSDLSYETQYKYSGLGSTLSLISGNIFKYFNKDTSLDLRISGMLNITSDFNTDTSLVTVTSIGELTPREGEVITTLPTKYTFGALFGWNKEFLILFDYVYQPWNEYTFNNTYDENLKNLTKISFGFQYEPEVISMHASSWEQMSWRCGLSFEESQYIFNGNNVNQYSIHAGVTFPFGGINLIDLSIAVGRRGEIIDDLVKEEFIKAVLTLSLGELWFQREER